MSGQCSNCKALAFLVFPPGRPAVFHWMQHPSHPSPWISLQPLLGCLQGPDTLLAAHSLFRGISEVCVTTQQYFLGRYEGSSIFTRAGDTKCSLLRSAHHLISFPFTKVKFYLEKPSDPDRLSGSRSSSVSLIHIPQPPKLFCSLLSPLCPKEPARRNGEKIIGYGGSVP